MAKGILYDPESFSEDQLILIKKGDGVVTTEGSGTNTVAQGNSTVPIYIGGKYAGYTVKNLDPVRGVEVVVDDAGNTKWLPYNVNERLVPYLNADGQLDLLGAVQGGITDMVDYAGWQVTQKELDDTVTISKYIRDGGFDAQKAYDDGVKLETIRTFASEFVPRQDLPTDNVPFNTDSVNAELRPYMTSSGGLDIFGAVANGITDLDAYKDFDVTQKDIDEVKSLVKYRTDDGRINVSQALKDGVDRNLLESYFDISEEKVSPTEAKVEDFIVGNSLNIEDAINAGVSDKTLKNIGVSQKALDKAKVQAKRNAFLKPYMKNGFVDMNQAVKSLSPEQLRDIDVDAKTVRLATLVNKYNREDGTFDTVSAIRDNVSDADLKSLGLTAKNIQDAKDIVVFERAGLDPSNYTLTEAIQKGVSDEVLYRWNDKTSVDNAKKYVSLDKFYVDGKTSIATAQSLGATEEQLRDLGFSDTEIKQYKQYDSGMKTLTDGGYINTDGNINLRKLFDDDKLNVLLDVNPEMRLEDISKIKNEFLTFDRNYVPIANGNYLAKSDVESLKTQMNDLGLTSKEQSQILADVFNTGDVDSYNRNVEKVFNDRVNALYTIDAAGNVTDFNYSSVKALKNSGKLDNYLKTVGIDDVAEWKQTFEDYNKVNGFINAQNAINRRSDGSFDDYMYSASQDVLDAYNRIYGTDYDFGKYNEIWSRSPLDQIKSFKKDKGFDLAEFAGYIDYVATAFPSTTASKVKNVIKDNPSLGKVAQTALAVQRAANVDYQVANLYLKAWNAIKDKAGIDDASLTIGGIEFGKVKDVDSLVGTLKDGVFTAQQKGYDIVHKEGRSAAGEQTLAIVNEAVVNDILLDPAAIVLSAFDSSNKAIKGKTNEGLAEGADLALSLALYPLTLGQTLKENKSQGIAEIVSIVVPFDVLPGTLKSVGKAASYTTFGKISDMTKAITSPVPDAKARTSQQVVISGQKTAKTTTLPLATGTLKEVGVEVNGFRPADFGNVVSSGIVSDKAGRDVNYTRYADQDGNITVQLYTGNKTKWDTTANKLVWDTIQEVSHETKLATGKSPAVTVVYGNYKVTSSPNGAKMSFVKGNTVHTVQATKNIAPYDYSNKYEVTNMGVKVTKTGKNAPALVVNNVKVQNYSSGSDGKITVENAKYKTVKKTDYGKAAKVYGKDFAKTAKQVVSILIEPRFTKSILADVKKVIDSKIPRTFEDNYKALQQLTFALQSMDPKDVAKVEKWSRRSDMKRLLDNGEYAKFVEIIGLDKVEVPRVWSKDWEAIYKDNTNPKSKEMSQEFLDRLRRDITAFQNAQTARYQRGRKVKQAAGKAIIPVLLATKLAMPASYGFDIGKVSAGPRIELVEGRVNVKTDDTKTDTKVETKVDKKADTKVDVAPKLDEGKLADLQTKPSSRYDIETGKVDVQRSSAAGPELKNLGSGRPTVSIDEKTSIDMTISDRDMASREITGERITETSRKATSEQTKINADKLGKVDTQKDVKADIKDVTKSDIDDIVKQQADEDIKVDTKKLIQNRLSDYKQQLIDTAKIDTTQKIQGRIRTPNRRLNIKTPRPRLGSDDGKGKKERKEKLGPVMVAWRQGSLKIKGRSKPVWIVVRKQGNQLVKSYEYKTPEGAPVSKGKAYQTLFHRGKKVRPFRLKVGFSNVTVDLSKSGKERIRYEKAKYKLPTQRQISKSRF